MTPSAKHCFSSILTGWIRRKFCVLFLEDNLRVSLKTCLVPYASLRDKTIWWLFSHSKNRFVTTYILWPGSSHPSNGEWVLHSISCVSAALCPQVSKQPGIWQLSTTLTKMTWSHYEQEGSGVIENCTLERSRNYGLVQTPCITDEPRVRDKWPLLQSHIQTPNTAQCSYHHLSPPGRLRARPLHRPVAFQNGK